MALTDIFVYGINHNTADVEIREKLAFSTEARFLALAKMSDSLKEAVFVSTCNRIEVIGTPYKATTGQAVCEILAEQAGLEAAELEDHAYLHQGQAAVKHVFRVASGLDSMVVGETQITGQIKTAFEEAFDRNAAGRDMVMLYQRMLNAAKAVRTQTELGRGAVSVSSMAVQLAQNIFDDLSDKHILLVGAGEMCKLAAEHFRDTGVAALDVVNRSPEPSRALAAEVGGTSHAWADLAARCSNADVILASTGSPEPIIDRKLVAAVMKKRRRRPLLMIDIAVPRDIDASVNRVSDVYLFNIDDLQNLIDANMKTRRHEAVKAEALVQDKLADFMANANEDIGPLIAALQERASTIKDGELERLFRKHPDWDEEHRERVKQTVNLIVNKILHDPIISLRQSAGDKTADTEHRTLTDVFRQFFNLN
jgi:glutamyl-tRNA reductase